MDKHVTYILGAGASCYSQPLVSDMKERMNTLLHMLDGQNQSSDILKFKGKTDELYKKYSIVMNEILKHITPDTYAKKLFLTGEIDKLKLLKEFLNLYFLFEQDQVYDAYVEKPKEKYPKSELWQKIFTPIDHRYDHFFATLLQKDFNFGGNAKLVLPQNINIISWNYDNQIELAYQYYAGNQTYSEIYETLSIDKQYTEDASNIVKLNGYCKIYNMDTNKKITFTDQIESLIDGNYNIPNNINFAWEPTDKHLNIIKSIIAKTEILIIIGYSFPNFNRTTDNEIFNKCNITLTALSNTVLIQVPEKDEFIKIKEKMQTIGYFDDRVFKHISDADQFYIPL